MSYPAYSVLIYISDAVKPEWLSIALDSMINQTVKPAEIVLVQDGPLTDGLNAAVNRYKKEFPTLFKILVNVHKVGLALALRQGVISCSNGFIACMDADGYSVRTRIEEEFKVMLDEKVDMVGSNVNEFIDSTDNVVARRIFPQTPEQIYKFAKQNSPMGHTSVLFKKRIVLACGNYEKFYLAEDYGLFIKLLSMCAKGYNIQKPLVYKRVSKVFYKQRSGWDYLKAMLLFNKTFYNAGWFSYRDYVNRSIANCFESFLPCIVKNSFVYRKSNRKKNVDKKVIRVAVLGTRGIPDVQGGIETHCQHLYPRLAQMGFDITLFGRRGYVKSNEPYDFQNVHVVPQKCSRKSRLEAITHMLYCFKSVFKLHSDIVHIHAIGPALFVPLFRFTGAKVVYTNHGQDYMRAKWGKFARFTLKMGERLGTMFSHRIIVVSKYIQDFLKRKYKTNRTVLIRNGVEFCTDKIKDERGELARFSLEPQKYILACGRFVEEKGFHDLIAAYEKLPEMYRDAYKLVIAGRADHNSAYSQKLIKMAEEAGVVLTGFICGDTLRAVQRNARLFVIPSYHEGLPIALLEALSYNLDVVASDIPANTEVPLPQECFAKVGDTDSLAQCITEHLQKNVQGNFANIVREYYDWDKIAEQTAFVYKDLVSVPQTAQEDSVRAESSNLQDERLQMAS